MFVHKWFLWWLLAVAEGKTLLPGHLVPGPCPTREVLLFILRQFARYVAIFEKIFYLSSFLMSYRQTDSI